MIGIQNLITYISELILDNYEYSYMPEAVTHCVILPRLLIEAFFVGTGVFLIRHNNNGHTKCRSQWPRVLRLRFYGRSAAEIVGSNPTGTMHVCLLCVLCVVR